MPNLLTPSSAGLAIQLAYEDAAIVAEGQAVGGDQIVRGLQRMTDMINFWQTQGIKLFLNQLVSITLVQGQGTYVLGPGGGIVTAKPTRVIECFYVDSTGNRRQLIPMAWHDWNMLSQQLQQGSLNSYFADKQAFNINLHFWQVPDSTAATGTVSALVQVQQTGPIALTDTMQFPPEWFIALRSGLAAEVSIGQPQTIVAACETRAKTYREALENWDVEDVPVRFMVDQRGFQNYGRFR
jgi:hypothetical protein